MGAPASFARPNSIVETIEGARTSTIDKGSVTEDGDVVKAEVPHGGIDHSVATESHHGTNNGSGEDVVPVVVFVDRQGTADQASTKEGRVEGDQLPHSRVVVGEDFELGIEIEIQEDEAGEGSGSVARRHRLKGVIDFLLVTSADTAIKHDRTVTVGDVGAGGASRFVGIGVESQVGWNDRFTYGEEVRA